ncbi:MAG: 4Fe-4S binding protein [Desulfovibrionaceae bacterium]|nr:4Fe-4S binding protein [Desulfovibrionaceae bacterium]
MKHIRSIRRCVQLLVFLGFCILPWLGETIRGSLFALRLGPIPFADPVATLQTLCGNWPGMRLLFGAGFTLIIALLCGRIFCSWICPYGFLSELVHRKNAHPKQTPFKQAFLVKSGLLAFALLVFLIFSYPLLGLISFPGELSLLPLLAWQNETVLAILIAAALPILALLLELATGKRLWCRYVCPQSVLLGFASGSLPDNCLGLRIRWNPKACTCKGEAPCRQACTLGLNPRHILGPNRRDCTQCCDCVQACSAKGQALTWSCTTGKKTIDKYAAKN